MSLSLSLSLSVYIYMCVCVCVCVYIYQFYLCPYVFVLLSLVSGLSKCMFILESKKDCALLSINGRQAGDGE